MNAKEVGQKLVELCRAGKNREAVETLYSDDVVSIEAASGPDMPQRMEGKEAVLGKTDWWFANHEIHKVEVRGPYPHGDRFIVWYHIDVTFKPKSQRMQMEEVGLYTVRDGKVVQEEYFYDMPG